MSCGNWSTAQPSIYIRPGGRIIRKCDDGRFTKRSAAQELACCPRQGPSTAFAASPRTPKGGRNPTLASRGKCQTGSGRHPERIELWVFARHPEGIDHRCGRGSLHVTAFAAFSAIKHVTACQLADGVMSPFCFSGVDHLVASAAAKIAACPR
jgi:hypothetical protein